MPYLLNSQFTVHNIMVDTEKIKSLFGYERKPYNMCSTMTTMGPLVQNQYEQIIMNDCIRPSPREHPSSYRSSRNAEAKLSRRRRSDKDACSLIRQSSDCSDECIRMSRRPTTDPPESKISSSSRRSRHSEVEKQQGLRSFHRRNDEFRNRQKKADSFFDANHLKGRRHTCTGSFHASRDRRDAPSIVKSPTKKRRSIKDLSSEDDFSSLNDNTRSERRDDPIAADSFHTETRSQRSKTSSKSKPKSKSKSKHLHLEKMDPAGFTLHSLKDVEANSPIPRTLSTQSCTTYSNESSCFNAEEDKSANMCLIVPSEVQRDLYPQVGTETPPVTYVSCPKEVSPSDFVDIRVVEDCEGFRTPPKMTTPPSSPPPTPKGRLAPEYKEEHHAINHEFAESKSKSFSKGKIRITQEQLERLRPMSKKSNKNRSSITSSTVPSTASYDDEGNVPSSASHRSTRSKANSVIVNRKEEAICRQVQQIIKRLIQEQQIACTAWDEVAGEYHRRIEPFTSVFVPHLLDPQHLATENPCDYYYLNGKSVLDVAAGTGAASLYAASRGASLVTATDFSENMLEVVQRRIAAVPRNEKRDRRRMSVRGGDIAAGVGHGFEGHYPRDPSQVVETVLADGLCLPSEWIDKYDIVCSNFGVIYFPRISQGIAEMAKCAKPGTGKVCLSGWGSSDETEAFRIFPAAMKKCGFDNTWYHAQSEARRKVLEDAGIPQGSELEKSNGCDKKGRKGRQQQQNGGTSHEHLSTNYFCPTKRIASSESLLRNLMVEAGLADVQVVGPIARELRLASAEEYWNRFVLASPNLKRVVEKCLNEEEALQLKKAVFKLLRKHSSFKEAANEAEVVLQASVYIAFGTKAQ